MTRLYPNSILSWSQLHTGQYWFYCENKYLAGRCHSLYYRLLRTCRQLGGSQATQLSRSGVNHRQMDPCVLQGGVITCIIEQSRAERWLCCGVMLLHVFIVTHLFHSIYQIHIHDILYYNNIIYK